MVSLGDTQIATSLALLMTANFAVGCDISTYHYNLVCKLVLISSAAHIGSMAFVHQYFSRSKTLGCIRIGLIALSLIFAWVLLGRRASSDIFPLTGSDSSVRNANEQINTGLVLPASCFIDHPGVSGTTSYGNFTALQYWSTNFTATVSANSSTAFGSVNNSTSFGNGTSMSHFQRFSSNDVINTGFTGSGDVKAYIAVTIALALTVSASAIHHHWKDHHWIAWGMRVVSFFAVYGVFLYGCFSFWALKKWMSKSKWFDEKDDGENTIHSFGQLMPVVLLILPLLALAETKWSKSPSIR